MRAPGYYWVSIEGDDPDIARFGGNRWFFDGLAIAAEHVDVLGPVAPYEPASSQSTSQRSRIRGLQDAAQDSFKSCPFASVGGLSARSNMQAPSYIPADQADAYLEGYREAARHMYGDDGQTAELSWKPTLTIPGKAEGEST